MVKGLIRFALIWAISMLLAPYVSRLFDQLAEKAPQGSFLEETCASSAIATPPPSSAPSAKPSAKSFSAQPADDQIRKLIGDLSRREATARSVPLGEPVAHAEQAKRG